MIPPKCAETSLPAAADHGDDAHTHALALPLVQLPPDTPVAALTRIRPECNEWRFYHIEIWPDLFGGVLLARNWGRIGTEGRLRFDFHVDHAAALGALTRLAATKRRRGYQDVPA
jgi:predicted DNA-binding WGR domain protein